MLSGSLLILYNIVVNVFSKATVEMELQGMFLDTYFYSIWKTAVSYKITQYFFF